MHKIEDNKDLQDIIYKIIEDHILYSCSIKTLNLWRRKFFTGLVTEEEEKQMTLRKNVIYFIRNKQTDLAFDLLYKENIFELSQEEDKVLYNLLSKLSFIDLIWNNQVEEAIEFAKKYLEKKNLEKLYSLIGYEELTDEIVEKTSSEMKRKEIMNNINSFLFYKMTGRKCSLLHSAVDYYDTLIQK
ncbi:hypothetical protein NBO_73g0027 [Nosema bombycis CQ1]|uniref:CTLH domain-containing protein n=1 Tax=Nosema bombycis (strain CQ1 / CVCC 102059) TaxID=578461 RepID=R0KRS7_NOSB1|nr:hypothetical protein NBO_73g0027 [Nosema bombycis CQ1]|eukprot:EOB13461.1 hypothetical protein NBO_73g0027 [Nosema bombycis CQ1]